MVALSNLFEREDQIFLFFRGEMDADIARGEYRHRRAVREIRVDLDLSPNDTSGNDFHARMVSPSPEMPMALGPLAR